MSEQPQTTLSEVITSPTEEKKPEQASTSEANPPQSTGQETTIKESSKKIEASQENKDKSI